MKKILLSSSLILAVAAIVVGGTYAYFSDTETSVGNTFTAGTIDIAIGGENPWAHTYTMGNMQPGEKENSNFIVSNTGSNMVNVTKIVSVTGTAENSVTEPEQAWYAAHGGTEKNDIDTVTKYYLSVVVKDASAVTQWTSVIYDGDVTISAINGTPVSLGSLPVGWTMEVTEEYEMDGATTENWAQSDSMTFDITVVGEQLKGVATLENKNPSTWKVISGDDVQGTLTYAPKGDTFVYSFTGKAPSATTGYSLVMYPESFSTPLDSGSFPRNVIVLGAATSNSSGSVSIPSTSVNLNQNIRNMKVWLVKTADLSGNTIVGWTPASYLFDMGFIDYDDTDL